jgi:inner membrane protein involved in colicin E2 resistance
MLIRIFAISFILVGSSIAWLILGGTIDHRTYQSDERLRSGVASIWGSPQEQWPPTASYARTEQEKVETETDGHRTTRTQTHRVTACLPLESSRISTDLKLEHRRKGLLWYSTYVVDFEGVHTFHNPTSDPQLVTFRFKFPAEHAIYDGLTMEVNGRPLAIASDAQGASVAAQLGPYEAASLRIAYRSHGLDTWRYRLGGEVSQARDFTLHATTNFRDIDFPLDTLSPTAKRETASGWDLTWRFSNLISGFQIGVTMPEKLQPGPLAGQVSYFAPVSLLLFFFLMFVITTLRSIDLHPMNYFFLAAAFFSFHLLLAYLVDHISIHLAFLICSAVSIFLVISYLRLVVGPRFAFLEAGCAQFIYLVLFSYAFFLHGFTGLAVTIGCIITLFIVMQMTARVRWAERFRRPPTQSAAPGNGLSPFAPPGN